MPRRVKPLLLVMGLVASLAPWCLAAQEPLALVIADFNDPAQYTLRRNARGGAFEAWGVGTEVLCKAQWVAEDGLGHPVGGALRLTYSVEPPPHFNGWYTFLGPDQAQGLDLGVYDRIGFFAKGTTGFTVEVKDRTSKDDGSPAGVAEYVVPRLGTAWSRVEIPFAAFRPKDRRGALDWSGIRQLVIVFSDGRSEHEGEVTVDHFYVSKGTPVFQ